MDILIKDKLCFALDVSAREEAKILIEELSPWIGTFKVGPELLMSTGPAIFDFIKSVGSKSFLDLKLYDIPETVERTIIKAIHWGVNYMTVHTSGGRNMMKVASLTAGDDLKLLGVTILTSMDNKALEEIGYCMSNKFVHNMDVKDIVFRLTRLANESGISGIVCSANEIPSLKLNFTQDLFYVTPGIRLNNSKNDDQIRVSTVSNAIKSGSDMLVIGRPIRDSKDRVETMKNIHREIENIYKELK